MFFNYGFREVIPMRKIFVCAVIAASLVFATCQIAGASDLCCIGKTEKQIQGVCVVKHFQEGRICLEEIQDAKSKSCWVLSVCYQLKDLGSAKAGDHVIVTGWREGDMKCYQGPNCGKVIVMK